MHIVECMVVSSRNVHCSLSGSARSSPRGQGAGPGASQPSPASSPGHNPSPGGDPAAAPAGPSRLATPTLTPNRSALYLCSQLTSRDCNSGCVTGNCLSQLCRGVKCMSVCNLSGTGCDKGSLEADKL